MRPTFFIVLDIFVVIMVMRFAAAAAQGRHYSTQMILVQAEVLVCPSTYIDVTRRYTICNDRIDVSISGLLGRFP